MDETKREFLREEEAGLRDSVRATIDPARTLERYLLVVTGGVWTWLVAADSPAIPRISYWIPFVLALLALIREVALSLDLQRMTSYMRDVEAEFCGSDHPRGWENTVNPEGATRIPVAPLLFWAILLVVTALVPYRYLAS